MKRCQKCQTEISGSFGSGLFCGRACSNSRIRSKETRAKISASLFGRSSPKKGSKWSSKQHKAIKASWERRFATTDFTEMCWPLKRRKIIVEQNYSCNICGNTMWQNKAIPLEIDHINGDRTNETRSNLQAVCPNCHALTPTYKGRNNNQKKTGRIGKKYTDIEMINAIKKTPNMNSCLRYLDLRWNSYRTILNIIGQYHVDFTPP